MYNFVISEINAAELGVTWRQFDTMENCITIPHWEAGMSGVESWLEKCSEDQLNIKNLKGRKYNNVWSSLDFRDKFPLNNKLCFIFFSRDNYFAEKNILKVLRNSYPDAKFVMYFTDMVHTHPYYDIEVIKDRFDVVLTTIDDEAVKYGLTYYPYIYTEPIVAENNLEYDSDVLFVGSSKDRLAQLYSLFEYFRSNNLKCNFHIVNAPTEDRKYSDQIYYEEAPIPYSEIIKMVKRTRCILDVKQSLDPTSIQPRPLEAILYKKKFLTNETNFIHVQKYNHPLFSRVFKKADDIDTDWIRDDKPINYQYEGEFSPSYMLEWLEQCFEKKSRMPARWEKVFDVAYLKDLGIE